MTMLVEEEIPLRGVGVSPERVFETWLNSMNEVVAELAARRRFDEQVGEWMRMNGCAEVFEAWRRKQEIAKKPDGPRVQGE